MKHMKILSKALTVLMTVCMLVSVVTPVLAAPNPSDYTGSNSAETGAIENIGNQIITIVSTIGSIASVIVLIVLGVKYMMGSAEEKAEYKKTLLPYIIGAALVFAASAIAGVVFNFANSFTTGNVT